MQKGVKRALLIGINYFNTSAELSGCQADISDVKEYLARIGYTEFVVLKDSKDDKEHKNPDCPTYANITKCLREVVGLTHPGDTLYIHYSGHGTSIDDTNGDEKDGKDECICPADYATAGMLPDDELNDILVDGLKASAKLRVVFDCCHSGTALDLPVRWVAGTNFNAENNNVQNKDIVFISGCRDEQYSADTSFDNKPNGALTWALLKSLNEIKKSGKMATTWRWKDLGEMVRIRLRRGGFDQVPQIGLCLRSQLSKYVDII